MSKELFNAFIMGTSIVALTGALVGLGSCLGRCGEGLQTAQEEVGPKALNAKYNWFKEAAAQIKVQQANIANLKARNAQVFDAMGPRDKWNRSDSDTYAQFQTELSGTIAGYNRLVGEYNANMAKFHTKIMSMGNPEHFDFEVLAPVSFQEEK